MPVSFNHLRIVYGFPFLQPLLRSGEDGREHPFCRDSGSEGHRDDDSLGKARQYPSHVPIPQWITGFHLRVLENSLRG